MARLNEPVVPTESIESLKKRFMRQNREIARVNSNQAIRIRNLENEVSAILAENLALREQVAHYKLEIDNDPGPRIMDHTLALKTQLEAKLAEFGAIIEGLGQVPRGKKTSPKPGRISLSHSGQERAPRERKHWLDQEGRLPPIMENKSYPRKTLEHQEITQLMTNTDLEPTDSPDIGPPPVSKFVDEDPVRIDLPNKKLIEDLKDAGNDAPALCTNLEQRRRRRDSNDQANSEQLGYIEMAVDSKPTNTQPKAGAKRKLSIREDEEARDREYFDDAESSTSTRNLSDQSAQTRAGNSHIKSSGDNISTRPQIAPRPSGRKVLAPKSVNNSPRKALFQVKDESKSSTHKVSDVDLARKRIGNKPMTVHNDSSSEDALVSSADTLAVIEAEPETPAVFDMGSPSSSRPSTTVARSRDTPPPQELATEPDGQRPSRRARGAVSYAEPNLRDKMRRPTKEMVDAVIRDEGRNRIGIHKIEDGNILSSTKIKTERDADTDWRKIPAAGNMDESPLRNKTAVSDSLPSSITTHRRRRESLLHQHDTEDQGTVAGNTIVAMLAEKRKAKIAEKAQRGEHELVADILESGGTGEVLHSGGIMKEQREPRLPGKSKRASIISREISLSEDAEASGEEVPRKVTLASSRRRQSSLGLGVSQSTDASSKRDMAGVKRSISNSAMLPPSQVEPKNDLKRSISTSRTLSSAPSDAQADRVGGRRRSMML